jgi:hypothetical protein
VKRARLEPAEDPIPVPTPPARSGGKVGTALMVVGLIGVVFAAASGPKLNQHQWEAAAAGVLLVWAAISPMGRRWLRRSHPAHRRRWAVGVWLGGVVAGWSGGYLYAVLAGVIPPVLWGAASGRSRRVSQPTEDVKPAQLCGPDLGEQWPTAARRTGLVHRLGPAAGQPVELSGPVVPNGVGGEVLTTVLPPGVSPADVADRSRQLEKWLQRRWVFVRPAGGDVAVMDRAELHCYARRPLAARPIPWQWLGEFYVPGVHAVPYAADVYGEPLHLDMRKCTLLVGESRIGKTGVQLAMLAGCALADIPVQVHLIDNRGGGDRELSALAGAVAGYARTAPEAWWQVHLLEREMVARRDDGVAKNGENFQPTTDRPLKHLVLTELLALLTTRTSRPPTDAELAEQFGLSWPEYTGGRFERRPSSEDWHVMFAESIGGITREGGSVGVSLSACTQGAQLDMTPTMRYARRNFPQNIALRLRTGSDVDPALGEGALAAGAHAHELPPDVKGLLYVRPDGMTVVHGRAAWVPPTELADVAALLGAAHSERRVRSSE